MDRNSTSSHPPPGSDDRRAGGRLNRREILLGGAGALVLPSLLPSFGVTNPGSTAEAVTLSTKAAKPLSLGYVEGSDGMDLKSPPWEVGTALKGLQVVPAESLLMGDSQLSGESVRLRLLDVFPNTPFLATENTEAATFAVRYRQEEDVLLPMELDFLAWGLRRDPFTQGQRMEFVVPVGLAGEIDLVVEVETLEPATRTALRALRASAGAAAARRARAAAVTVERFTTTFTIDALSGVPKLQRGLYLVGFGAKTWSSSLTLPMLRQAAANAGRFRSLLISIDTPRGLEGR